MSHDASYWKYHSLSKTLVSQNIKIIEHYKRSSEIKKKKPQGGYPLVYKDMKIWMRTMEISVVGKYIVH